MSSLLNRLLLIKPAVKTISLGDWIHLMLPACRVVSLEFKININDTASLKIQAEQVKKKKKGLNRAC